MQAAVDTKNHLIVAQSARAVRQEDFIYVTEDNTYRCPAGESLTWRFASVEHGMVLHNYWKTRCGSCALKAQRTTGKERRIKRWEHEAVLDGMQHRLDRAPGIMRIRRQTVETSLTGRCRRVEGRP
jgi:transposase